MTTKEQPDRILILDLKTTTPRWDTARIVELSFLEVSPDLEARGSWTKRVNPGVPIPADATHVHGITDIHVADAAGFHRYAPRVQRLVEGATLVAYNAKFDLNVLHHELLRAGQPGLREHPPVLDPARIFRDRLQDSSYRLGDAVRVYLQREHTGRKEPMGDVLAILEVLREQRTVHGELWGETVDRNVLLTEVEWLDPNQRFYRDGRGVVRFNFGKHEDEPVEGHEGYLRWMLGRGFEPGTYLAVRRLLETPGLAHAPGSLLEGDVEAAPA